MASLRPSVFNQLERVDGGPFLLVETVEQDDGFTVDVAFTDTPPDQRQGDFPIARLLHVAPDFLRIWPLNVRPDRADYLKPKYGTLESICVAAKVGHSWALPHTEADVVELLEALPDGFAKGFRFGLGLLWEYRSICETIADQKLASMLIVHGGEEATLTPPTFVLGVRRFHALRKEINQISARRQRDARRDKTHLTYQDLLHAADPDRFPRQTVSLRPDSLDEATRGGRDTVALSRRDRRAAVKLVQANLDALAASETAALLALKGEIEQVTLKQLIDLMTGMLDKNLSEASWQAFLENNPFVLSLAFPMPVLVVRGRAYVGGKRVDDRGGRVTDFLCASALTGNLAVVEIKRPSADLVANSAYRGDDVFAAASDLSGAIAQALDQRLQLQTRWPAFKDEAERPDLHGFAIGCIVIIGKIPEGRGQRRSFELYRKAMSDVTIVTFDELRARLQEIYDALAGGQ
jgi:hypothetical protein